MGRYFNNCLVCSTCFWHVFLIMDQAFKLQLNLYSILLRSSRPHLKRPILYMIYYPFQNDIWLDKVYKCIWNTIKQEAKDTKGLIMK